jgi:hypothetical protein
MIIPFFGFRERLDFLDADVGEFAGKHRGRESDRGQNCNQLFHNGS